MSFTKPIPEWLASQPCQHGLHSNVILKCTKHGIPASPETAGVSAGESAAYRTDPPTVSEACHTYAGRMIARVNKGLLELIRKPRWFITGINRDTWLKYNIQVIVAKVTRG